MALTDCIECWSTPCTCGHDYKGWSKSRKDELIKAVQGFTTEELIEWIQDAQGIDLDKLVCSSAEDIIKLFKDNNK